MAKHPAFGRKRGQPEMTAAAAPLPGTQRRSRQPFPALTENLHPAPGGLRLQSDWSFPAAQAQLYTTLRGAVPIIDAAIFRLVRLLGGFALECDSVRAQRRLRSFMENVPVGGNQWGLSAFVSGYFEQLLTLGTALGELILREDGAPAALWNASPEGVALRRAKNGVDVEICIGEADRLRPVPYPALCFLSALNPDPGALLGNSLLKGLPFVSGVLLSILNTLGQNWERLGNVRFAVTYRPGNDPADRAHTQERTQLLAKEWQQAMQEGAGVRDFIAAGDVSIQVIGADAPIPDSEIPVRQLLEQIIAKTGLPPFLLGLTWSSTERMSTQQADLLTSEMESYRRTLTPVILRLCTTVLRLWGENPECRVVWEDITLADETELSRAALLRAQAQRLCLENEQRKG
ncbi:MAG: serine/threonine protein phosphatase [Oscillospiraceae bacterium]|jgi:hypothetical protein|nr:serine/threonine protein phosphatase [Oscillospiraceae bacterium]